MPDNNKKDEEYIDVYAALENFSSNDIPKRPQKTVKTETVPDKKTQRPVQTQTGQKRVQQNNSQIPKKKSRNIFPIVLSVIVLLGGCAGVAALAGAFSHNSAPVAAESSQESFYTVESSVPAVAAEPEESSNSSEFKLEPTGAFKVDKKVFSKNVTDTLDKQISSKYVVLYDVTSDKILYEKNGSDKCYPASTTKMLTAIVGAKIIPPETVITVGDEIKLINWDSSTAGLVKGMKLTFEMLMDALMLPSGNDAAYTIAVNAARMYTGNNDLSDEEAVKTFMELVNKAAAEIGCKGTHYVTPDGWHDDDHYTSAEDLARIAAYARTVPLVKNSFGKFEAEWDVIYDETSTTESSNSESSADTGSSAESSADSSVVSSDESGEISENADESSEEEEVYKPSTLYWTNSNKMLDPESSCYSKFCDGIKTGFTDEAGTSVVCSATVEGHTMIAVIMFGYTMYTKYDDANRLFKQGFATYGLNYTYNNEGNENDVEL